MFLLAAVGLLALAGPTIAADAPPTLLAAAPTGDNACAAAGVLSRIKHRFGVSERTQWKRGFVIAAIGNPRPSGHPFAEPGLVKRDFCTADSVMTNGMSYPVFYTVEHRLGFAGLGNYVDFCVLGLDPWHVHDGDCRTVR